MKKDNRIKISDIHIGVRVIEEYDEVCDDYFVEKQEIVILEKLDYKFCINDKEKIRVCKSLLSGKSMYLDENNEIIDLTTDDYKYFLNFISLRELVNVFKKIDDILSYNYESVRNEYKTVLNVIKNKVYITRDDFNRINSYIQKLYIYFISGTIDEIIEEYDRRGDNNIIDFDSAKEKVRKK